MADIIGSYEQPLAEKEGHSGLAGDYHPIEVASSSLKQYYLGYEHADSGDEDNKTIPIKARLRTRYPHRKLRS